MSPTFTEETQPEAIRRAQEGDAAAFEYLYKANSKRVYSLCLRMLKNTSDAEDLTQQVFLRLFRRIGTFRSDACFFTAKMFGSCRFTCTLRAMGSYCGIPVSLSKCKVWIISSFCTSTTA